jgi:predicted permease
VQKAVPYCGKILAAKFLQSLYAKESFLMKTIWQDVRFSARTLIKNPVLTVVLLLTLSLGVGANTAIFSLVNGILFQPLPYSQPDRLIMVWGTEGRKGKDTVVPADFLDWKRETSSFAELAGFSKRSLDLVGQSGPERVNGLSTTGNYFITLGVKPFLGRTFLANARSSDEESSVAVISYGLWQRSFGADRSVIGRKVSLSGNPYTVIGVMPPGFRFHDDADVWVRAFGDVPALGSKAAPELATRRGLSYMRAFGRLKPGVTVEQARADLGAVAGRQAKEFPKTNSQRGVLLVPMREEVVGGDVRTALLVLFAAVGFVLVIACSNVASLLFARATSRQREITLRVALGATRGRLVRQLLTESLLLGLLAGACGLLLGFWSMKILVRLSPSEIPRLSEIHIDASVVAFTLAVALLTAVLAGLLPLLQVRKIELAAALKEGGTKASSSLQRRRIRGYLVVAEVAVAVVLLIAAGIMIKSFSRLRGVKTGFNSAQVLSFQVVLPGSRYQQEPQQAAFFSRALSRIQALPGVRSAATVLSLPLSGDDINISFSIEGRPTPDSQVELRDGFQVASSDYFHVMNIPVLKGRGFISSDVEGAPRVAVISEEMAKRYWPDRDPLGSRITYDKPDSPDAKWFSVVGIVGNVKFDGPGGGPRAEAYLPFAQSPWPMMGFVMETSGDPLRLAPAVRQEIQAIDPEQPITGVLTMDERLSQSVSRPRFTSVLLGSFAAVALLLAAIGIYGVMAYSVEQRFQEIGIKMALGAQQRTIMGEVVKGGMALTLVGIVMGLLGAVPLTGFLKALVFEVSVNDFWTFSTAPVVLTLVALIANLVPAVRASRVSPLIAMRRE